jgi:biopolymer transport protein ExbB/TolQ
VVASGLLAATWARGWLDGALAGETLLLCAVIAAVFCYGLVLCALQIAAVNRALNQVRAGSPRADSHAAHYLAAIEGRAADTRMVQAGLLRLRLAHPTAVVRHIANALVFLGLVGTVIGFIVALSGVDPELTASVDKVAPMVSTLINGMSIALYTTLIGAVLHVWLMIGYRMLATGAVQLYDATLELGERRVRD